MAICSATRGDLDRQDVFDNESDANGDDVDLLMNEYQL